MNKILNNYYSLYNNLHKLFINNDILDLINIIDNIGFEEFLKRQLYNNIYNKIKENNNIDINISLLKINITIDNICNFILNNISFTKFNKIALYGFISINKYDKKLVNIIENDNNILLIFLNKVYSEFIIEQFKEFIKFYLFSLNIDIDYDNFNNNFDENIKKFINHLRENNKIMLNHTQNMNEQYNNDLKLLNQALFNV